jgi:hypothetical protein
MYIQKTMDSSFPPNIITAVSRWIDCYNDTIMEKTKINMHYDFDTKIDDTNLPVSSMKKSKSCKKSENESQIYEKEIFNWLASLNDENVDFYSDKLSKYMRISKESIIKNKVNVIRLQNKSDIFNSNFFVKKEEKGKDNKDKEEKDNKEEKKPQDTKKIVYGDAWDLL